MIKFLAILNVIQLVLILLGVIAFFIYKGIIAAKLNTKDKEIISLKKRVVEFHEFAKVLYANLDLLKYYEKVDIDTQIQIDRIEEDINQYKPIVNGFIEWIKNREKQDVVTKEGDK